MRRNISTVIMVLGTALASAATAAEVRQTAEAVTAELGNGVVLTFAVHEGWLLGLQKASVGGVECKSDRTCQRPWLAQEFVRTPQGWTEGGMAWPLMKLKSAAAKDGRVEIEVELCSLQEACGYNDANEAARRALFVFGPDRERAMRAENLTPGLKALKAKADAASALIQTALMSDAKFADAARDLAAVEEKLRAAEEAAAKNPHDKTAVSAKFRAEGPARRARQAVEKLHKTLLLKLAAGSKVLQAAQEVQAAWAKAFDEHAEHFRRIHRDFYRFAHAQLPAEAVSVEMLTAQATSLGSAARPTGTLKWIVEPHERNIAGWKWAGWTQRYEFEIKTYAAEAGRPQEAPKVNCLWQLGTWELEGKLDGVSVINLRYRGLGGLEQAFSAGADGRVREAFSTTETMPGAAGEPYAVSPVAPAVNEKTLRDRGYAMQHRIGAWIAQPARGAGTGFVDFQYRPGAALASFPLRQGNLRALSEAFPGDRDLSQTDVEFFANTAAGRTTPQAYLVLIAKDKPMAPHEWWTRWQEVDQHVRDMVAEELKFVPAEALPAVGGLWDTNFAGNISGLAKAMPALAESGVRMILLHNPGWVNGRSVAGGADGTKDVPFVGGGVCNVYDWTPLPTCGKPWKDLQAACAKHRVAYYVWLTGMSAGDAPFCDRVGYDPNCWALNDPTTPGNDTYGLWMKKHNIANARFAGELDRTLERARAQFGYQGFWGDSFQNLFMSQLDWAGGRGDGLQRAWWEWLAAYSRRGVGWMAESHSFPGLSCSIEVEGWESRWYLMQHVCKWYRGGIERNYKPEQLDENLFRVMSCKGWTAPDGLSVKGIPSFARMAAEYLAALPAMRRGYILADDAGMLWLPFDGGSSGVWFAFKDGAAPAGISAEAVSGADATPGKVLARHAYFVKGEDLLKAFGVRAAPAADPRLGRKYEPFRYAWPKE